MNSPPKNTLQIPAGAPGSSKTASHSVGGAVSHTDADGVRKSLRRFVVDLKTMADEGGLEADYLVVEVDGKKTTTRGPRRTHLERISRSLLGVPQLLPTQVQPREYLLIVGSTRPDIVAETLVRLAEWEVERGVGGRQGEKHDRVLLRQAKAALVGKPRELRKLRRLLRKRRKSVLFPVWVAADAVKNVKAGAAEPFWLFEKVIQEYFLDEDEAAAFGAGVIEEGVEKWAREGGV